MSEYNIHLGLLIAITLLGIEAAVILVRNGAGWLMMLGIATASIVIGAFFDGYGPAFAWLDGNSPADQAQFFELSWRVKATALLLRIWGYIFLLTVPFAWFHWREPAKRKVKVRLKDMR